MTFFEQPTLFNQPTPAHNNTETSKDAAESIKPLLNGMCAEVLNAVSSNPAGMTCDEVEQKLNMKHQTASARLNDLTKCQPPYLRFKLDEKTGQPLRRPTRSGRTARVYFANQHGGQ